MLTYYLRIWWTYRRVSYENVPLVSYQHIKYALMIGSLLNPYILVSAGDDAAANLVASLIDFADIPLAYLTI